MKRSGAIPLIDRAIIGVLGKHTSSRPDGLHGYELARLLCRSTGPGARTGPVGLRSNGTVYKALYRLSRCGAITDCWEEADVALEAGRPRRRYYLLTENGLARARLLGRAERLRVHRAEATTRSRRPAGSRRQNGVL